MNNLLRIYKFLFKQYGPQGWWPLLNCKEININKSGSVKGYHAGDYSFPKNNIQRFEICIGAVLTQNTAWINVEKALVNLRAKEALNARAISGININELKKAIRPAGYYNQKAGYIKEFARFFLSLNGRMPSRKELLAVKGIGSETADSILLYAYNQLEFVVDAYTKRIFSNMGFFDIKSDYHEIKRIFEKSLPRDISIYQEYHALIVEHAKRYYSRKDKCDGCMLAKHINNTCLTGDN